jgi:hypothetical protein
MSTLQDSVVSQAGPENRNHDTNLVRRALLLKPWPV